MKLTLKEQALLTKLKAAPNGTLVFAVTNPKFKTAMRLATKAPDHVHYNVKDTPDGSVIEISY